jgi:hypothetical protein
MSDLAALIPFARAAARRRRLAPGRVGRAGGTGAVRAVGTRAGEGRQKAW